MTRKTVKAKASGRRTKTAARKKAPARRAAPKARKTASRRAAPKTRASASRPASKARAKAGGRRSPAKTSKASSAAARKTAPARKRPAAKKAAPRRGGSGRERTLAQTPQTGRSVQGRTNPFPTRRSTGTPAGAGTSRHAPDLDRDRRHLREVEESGPGIPSSLDLDRRPSAARSGRAEMREARRDHPEVSPEITGGDVDADWEGAYTSGDEAPGGDNMTSDQDRVDDIGKALGVQYEDNEELKGADKIASRDKNRWELDPASSDDYKDRE